MKINKLKKKIIALGLSCALLFSLTSCDYLPDFLKDFLIKDSSSSNSSETDDSSSGEPEVIHVSVEEKLVEYAKTSEDYGEIKTSNLFGWNSDLMYAHALASDGTYIYGTYGIDNSVGRSNVFRYDVEKNEFVFAPNSVVSTETEAGITVYDGKIIVYDKNGKEWYTEIESFSSASSFSEYTDFDFTGVTTLSDVYYNATAKKFAVMSSKKTLSIFNEDKATAASVTLQGVSGLLCGRMTATDEYIYVNYFNAARLAPVVCVYDWSGSYVGKVELSVDSTVYTDAQSNEMNIQGVTFHNGTFYFSAITWHSFPEDKTLRHSMIFETSVEVIGEDQMVLSFLGDSITYGHGVDTTDRYTSLLDADENYVAMNYGISGTTIADCALAQYKEDSFTKRYTKISKRSDVIFVFGGTNDYGSGAGQEITLGTNTDTTIDTFYGGLDVLMKGLKTNYPNARICFITPIQRNNLVWGYPSGTTNSYGYTLQDYRNAIIEKCEEQNIDCLDMTDVVFPDSYFSDGLHPNAAGHALIEQCIRRYLTEEVLGTATASTVDNTEESLKHEKIYYYNQGNVPYDSDNDCYQYCFMTPYLAAKPTGGAILVFPGGAYSHLSNGNTNTSTQIEASEIAGVYNAAGISVFVVNYRTKSVDSSTDYRMILSDATRAMRYVRYNAAKFHVDPNKIGSMGFSAGAHMASMLLIENGYSWQIEDTSYTADAIDSVSAKANASVFSYGVLSFTDGATHTDTRTRFTNNNTTLMEKYAPDKNVTKDTAPCFVWHEEGDKTVPVAASQNFIAALQAAGVKYEAHIYTDAAVTSGVGTDLHGMGLAHKFNQANAWPGLSANFLKSLGF